MCFIKVLMTLSAVLLPVLGHARLYPDQNLDLECAAHGVSDGGYEVMGLLKGDVVQLQVTAVNGWGTDKIVFEGDARLKTATIDGKCEYQLVDKDDKPTMILALRPKGVDMLERLNNKDLVITDKQTGKTRPLFSELDCHVSHSFTQFLPECK